jgi:hypothetical protein
MTPGVPPGLPPRPAQSGARRGRHGTDDVPVVTGVPVGRPTTAPVPPFDVFTPMRRADQEGTPPADISYEQSHPDFRGRQPDSYVSPFADPDSSSYQGDGVAYGATGNNPDSGINGVSSAGYEGTDSASSGTGDFEELPRRVRQASLAPQLRASGAAGGSQGPAAVPPASTASLTDMRNTLSAMQRGWQQARAQAQQDSEGKADGD